MNKFRVIAVTFLLLISVSISRGAQEEEDLSWVECVRQAKRTNPDLLAVRAAVDQAEASKGEVRSRLLPQISGSLSTSRSKSDGDEAADSYSYRLSGSQLIFDGLRSWHELDQSEQALIEAQLGLDIESATVRLALRNAFVDLLRAQELILITGEIARRRKQQLDLVGLRYEAGREHRGSLLTSQANLSAADFDITKARRDVRISQKQLHREMGREIFKPIRVEGELEPGIEPTDEPAFIILMEQHPAVLKEAADRESARLDVSIARGEFSPDIYGTASLGRSDSEWPPRDEQWTLGVSLSLPIFEGGSRFEEVIRAKAALREAAENERSERDAVLLTLEESWVDLLDADERVDVQKKFLTAYEERARIAEAQYAAGMLSFNNWIIIEDDLVRSKKSYLQSRADALKAEAQWINAFGGTLDFNP